MLYAFDQRFDVTENLKKFYELNKAQDYQNTHASVSLCPRCPSTPFHLADDCPLGHQLAPECLPGCLPETSATAATSTSRLGWTAVTTT